MGPTAAVTTNWDLVLYFIPGDVTAYISLRAVFFGVCNRFKIRYRLPVMKYIRTLSIEKMVDE